MAWVPTRLWKLQKGCTRLAAARYKVYQLLAHGRWFSPGTPPSSTTKSCRHYIAEILLKVALNTKNLNQIICVMVLLSNILVNWTIKLMIYCWLMYHVKYFIYIYEQVSKTKSRRKSDELGPTDNHGLIKTFWAH